MSTAYYHEGFFSDNGENIVRKFLSVLQYVLALKFQDRRRGQSWVVGEQMFNFVQFGDRESFL